MDPYMFGKDPELVALLKGVEPCVVESLLDSLDIRADSDPVELLMTLKRLLRKYRRMVGMHG